MVRCIYLGGDGSVLVLVEDGERLLEGGELVGGERVEDLPAVGLAEHGHGCGGRVAGRGCGGCGGGCGCGLPRGALPLLTALGRRRNGADDEPPRASSAKAETGA